jgi:hypothetical protein
MDTRKSFLEESLQRIVRSLGQIRGSRNDSLQRKTT